MLTARITTFGGRSGIGYDRGRNRDVTPPSRQVTKDQDAFSTDVHDKVYLPAHDGGVNTKEYLLRYVEREFPEADHGGNAVHSVPREFQRSGGERQANLAEELVFERLRGLSQATAIGGLWMTFFHSASYAGRSFRNQRVGKLMIREHDFVIFAKYKEKLIVALAEIKSTNDASTSVQNLEVTSDAKVIKNNKRSAQHQLRDHMEILQGILDLNDTNRQIQCYIMWPFLGALTRDPKHQVIRRWKEDADLHVFADTLQNQEAFNRWFRETVLNSHGIDERHFITLLNRYIILSCGVFVDEIYKGMLALLTQEQHQLLNSQLCKIAGRAPLVVHGAAGTGKTLLVLRKLQQLYQDGKLNEQNRALYICYWPGIRCDTENKLKILGIDKYVDTKRFYITLDSFLRRNKSKYKHIFMDEAEAICLAFKDTISSRTIQAIYQCYHDSNCTIEGCQNLDLSSHINKEQADHEWGQLWFMVDINQASLFLPKHSPPVLKKPTLVLNKVMRCTVSIFDLFKQFYSKPMPALPAALLANMNLSSINVGHHFKGLPTYWVNSDETSCMNELKSKCIQCAVVQVVIDLCSSKGFKPNELCVIPFLVNENFALDGINEIIGDLFVENGYRPHAIGDVEDFLTMKKINDFLVAWALRVKGLEFKVVIMVVDEDDFDINDIEDRKKTYIISSRCTCLLILVCPGSVIKEIDVGHITQPYPFQITF